MTELNKNQNNFAKSIEYIDLPYYSLKRSFANGKKLPCSAKLLYGLIQSIAPENGNAWFSYDDIGAIVEIVPSTISAAKKRLDGIIAQNKHNRSHTRYTVCKTVTSKGFIRYDKELFRVIEQIYGKLRFTKQEKIIVSFMVGMAMRENAGAKYAGSYATIGKVCGCGKNTAQACIDKIVPRGLFHRPKEMKGTCSGKPSTYILDTALRLNYKRVVERRKAEAITRRAENSRVQTSRQEARQEYDATYMKKREAYYAGLQAADDKRRRELIDMLNSDPIYKENSMALIKCSHERLSMISSFDFAKEQEIGERYQQLQRAVTERLRHFGVSEEDLEPKYHCKYCEDTGFIPNGKPCGCYPYPRGRT